MQPSSFRPNACSTQLTSVLCPPRCKTKQKYKQLTVSRFTTNLLTRATPLLGVVDRTNVSYACFEQRHTMLSNTVHRKVIGVLATSRTEARAEDTLPALPVAVLCYGRQVCQNLKLVRGLQSPTPPARHTVTPQDVLLAQCLLMMHSPE